MAFTLVPGAYDVLRGSTTRGYIVLALSVFASWTLGFRALCQKSPRRSPSQ